MQSLLSDCRRIEELASTIYQQLANETSYANELRNVFQQLSNDEKSHARHIDLVLQANAKELDAIPAIAGEKIDEAMTLAEDLLHKVGRGTLSEEEALRLAVAMEQNFVKVHVNNAMYFGNRTLAEFFSKLGKEDEAHLDTLRACLNWWRAER